MHPRLFLPPSYSKVSYAIIGLGQFRPATHNYACPETRPDFKNELRNYDIPVTISHLKISFCIGICIVVVYVVKLSQTKDDI